MRHKILIIALLLLASAHCARSLFYENVNLLSWEKLEAGTENLPYQGRTLVIPLLRWAHTNPTLIHAADSANQRNHMPDGHRLGPEPESPEKIVSMLLGVLCVIGLGILATLAGRVIGARLWWLPWTLVLEILYTGYAARTKQNFWHVFDLPAYFLFGLGTYFLFRRQWLPILLLMPFAAANRETAIFLALLWLAAVWPEQARAKSILQTLALIAVWAPVRLVIWHWYRHNDTDVGSRIVSNLRDLFTSAQSWPQIASAFGFLFPILLLYRGDLAPTSKRLLWAMMPCLAVILWYGVWLETRIFGEFTLLFALLLTEIVDKRLLSNPARVSASL